MSDVETGVLIEMTFKELLAKKPDPTEFKGLKRARAEELRAVFKSYLLAIDMDDLPSVQALEPRVFEAPEEDLNTLASKVVLSCVRVEVEVTRHVERAGWFKRAKKEGVALYSASSPEQDLCYQMAGVENRAGVKTLVEMGLLSAEEALNYCVRAGSRALSAHWSKVLLDRGELPSQQTADALCASGAHLGYGFEAGDHPLERAWSAWSDLISQKARSVAWAYAVSNDQPGLVPALLKSGLSLTDWRLEEESKIEHFNKQGRDRAPKLLDFAISKKSERLKGSLSDTIKALLMIPEVAKGRDSVSPHALARGTAGDWVAYQKAGFNIVSADELGNTALHFQLGRKGYGSRLNRAGIMSVGKRLAPLFAIANQAGETPLSLLTDQERVAVQKEMALYEQSELKRELKTPKLSKSAQSAQPRAKSL